MKKARSEMKQNELYERLRKDMYPAVRKDIDESMMMQKTLTLTDSQQMGGEAGMEDAGYCVRTPRKSSCASADPSNIETAAAHDVAISDLSGMTDRLKGVLTHYEGTLKCATARVCPPFFEEGLLLDSVPLKSGCVKCYVNEVKPGFNEFALKNVLGDFDEQRTLGETLLHHIQWPRKEIEFMDEILKPRQEQPMSPLNRCHSPCHSSSCVLPPKSLILIIQWPMRQLVIGRPDFVPYRPCHRLPQSSQWQGLQLLKTHHGSDVGR